VVNLCFAHDVALGGLHRGIMEFSNALHSPILSVEPTPRPYDSSDSQVHRLEFHGRPRLGAAHYMDRSAALAVEELLARTRLLIVHSLFHGHAGFARRWAGTRKTPYWAVPHGCLDPWGMKRRTFLKQAWMAAVGAGYLRDAHRVVFSTKREGQKAARWLAGTSAVTIPFPVRIPDLEGRHEARIALRAALGLSESDRVLLSVGRLHRMKRVCEMLAAFVDAQAENVALVVVGGNDTLTVQELRRSVPTAAANRVFIQGPLYGAALHQAWLAADGFISLSFRENFGFSLADACAYGLPVIATTGHDLIHEMPVDGKTGTAVGWLLPDLATRTAVDAIRAFSAANIAQLQACGATGKRWADEELSPDRFRDALISMMA